MLGFNRTLVLLACCWIVKSCLCNFSHLFWGLGRRAYIYYLSDIIIISNMCIFLRCILRIYSLNVKLLHKNLAPHLHASEAHRRHELHGRHFSRAWKTLPKISRCDKNVQKQYKNIQPCIYSLSSPHVLRFQNTFISEYQVRQLCTYSYMHIKSNMIWMKEFKMMCPRCHVNWIEMEYQNESMSWCPDVTMSLSDICTMSGETLSRFEDLSGFNLHSSVFCVFIAHKPLTTKVL